MWYCVISTMSMLCLFEGYIPDTSLLWRQTAPYNMCIWMMQTMKPISLFLVLAVICRAAAFSVTGLANVLSTAGTVLRCTQGDRTACATTFMNAAEVVSKELAIAAVKKWADPAPAKFNNIWADPAPIPEVETRPRKCYGGGQFTPGGGRAPKGGICM